MQLVSVHEALSQGIEVFRLDLDLMAELSDSLPHLTPEERRRAARFVRAADRLRFAQTRAAARRLLGRRLGCCPADVPLAVGVHGKPFVDEDPQRAPVFNVSHSGVHALIALADPCGVLHLGVDIEQHKPAAGTGGAGGGVEHGALALRRGVNHAQELAAMSVFAGEAF